MHAGHFRAKYGPQGLTLAEALDPRTMAPANLIGGVWRSLQTQVGEGAWVRSSQPGAPGEIVWEGWCSAGDVDAAVAAARAALPVWSRTSFEQRAAVLRTFALLAKQHESALAGLLADEVGKVLWDAKAEAGLLASKVDITLDQSPTGGLARVTGFEFGLTATRTGSCAFRPHGVMAVVGPFNFPMHLPNGHIVPALAMGNTVVFKPSDKAPACGQALVMLLHEALTMHGIVGGVVNLVQGGVQVAQGLTGPAADIDGVLFTGSWPVGRAIMQASLDQPGRMLALEMGGNNAAIIMDDANVRQAVIECVRSAFIGTGQRCTCTRRVIVHEAVAQRVIASLCRGASSLMIGPPRSDHPVFMGPIIADAARGAVVRAQQAMQRSGGEVLVQATTLDGFGQSGGGWYVSPGVVRVEGFSKGDDLNSDAGADVEVFGPLLRVCVVRSFEEALAQAGATRFGLAASLFTQREADMERFMLTARAGCLNINTGTAGASSKLPFGGLGLSGNHRPAGSFSTDYCAYPAASMVERGGGATLAVGMQDYLE